MGILINQKKRIGEGFERGQTVWIGFTQKTRVRTCQKPGACRVKRKFHISLPSWPGSAVLSLDHYSSLRSQMEVDIWWPILKCQCKWSVKPADWCCLVIHLHRIWENESWKSDDLSLFKTEIMLGTAWLRYQHRTPPFRGIQLFKVEKWSLVANFGQECPECGRNLGFGHGFPLPAWHLPTKRGCQGHF